MSCRRFLPEKCWQQSANRAATRGQCLLGSVGGGWHMAEGAHRLLPHYSIPLLGCLFSFFQICRTEIIHSHSGNLVYIVGQRGQWPHSVMPVVSQLLQPTNLWLNKSECPPHFQCFRLIFLLKSIWAMISLSCMPPYSRWREDLSCRSSLVITVLLFVCSKQWATFAALLFCSECQHTDCPTLLVKVIGAVWSLKGKTAETTQG